MATATIFEAKTNLSELIKKAQAGEEVVITSGRERTPVARLEAIAPVKKQRLGLLAHLGYVLPESFFDPLPQEELAAWEGDSKE
jgi:prevent-host-death family protein